MRLTVSRPAHSLRVTGMRVAGACVFPSAVLAATLAAGCARTYDNPFAGSNPIVAPSASAAIVFASNAHGARAGTGREIFAVEESGANATRLTFCGEAGAVCASLEASFGGDRRRNRQCECQYECERCSHRELKRSRHSRPPRWSGPATSGCRCCDRSS